VSAVQLRLSAALLRELRQHARNAGTDTNTMVLNALQDYMRNGEPEERRTYPGVLLRATADVPAQWLAWVRSVAPFLDTTVDDAWNIILASYLSRHAVPEGLGVEAAAEVAA
jgi:hypothetical protein